MAKKSKDIDIHVKTPGADESAAKLDKVADSTKKVGDSVESSGSKTKSAASSFSSLAAKFLSVTAAIAALKTGFDMCIERLQIANQLQKEFASTAASMASVGQRLETQTGTVGKSAAWTQKAIEVQKAGGIGDISAARDLMVSADIAFGSQGGIKNKDVLNLLKQIAPFIGSTQLNSDEASKLFEFATTAGVAPTKQGYQDYFAKLKAGFTSSKSTSFGSFMQYLQQGGTGYINQGGSLEEAISLFSSARSVSPNEALAATLMEQLGRISAGGNAKARGMMEKRYSVNWSDLSMDQRNAKTLEYLKSMPTSQRIQLLTDPEFGVGAEQAGRIANLVSPDAMATAASTRAAVTGSSAAAIEKSNQAFMRSTVGRENIQSAEESEIDFREGGKYLSWQRRLRKAKKEYDALAAAGQDRLLVPAKNEPTLMALESLELDFDAQIAQSSGQERDDLIEAKKQLTTNRRHFYISPLTANNPNRMGQSASEALVAVQRANQTVINNNYNHSTNYYPRTGESGGGERYKQD